MTKNTKTTKTTTARMTAGARLHYAYSRALQQTGKADFADAVEDALCDDAGDDSLSDDAFKQNVERCIRNLAAAL